MTRGAELVLALGMVGSALYYLVARLLFYVRFRSRMPKALLLLIPVPWVFEDWYLTHRQGIGSRLLDLFVASLILSFLLFLACALILFRPDPGTWPTYPRGS